MKVISLLAALALGLVSIARAQTPPPSPASPVAAELEAIVGRVSAKLKTGPQTAATLAPELAAFDALLAKHPEKTDATAQVAIMKAMLFLQVLDDKAAAIRQLKAVVADYAGTQPAAQVTRILAQIEQQAKSQETQKKVVGQQAPQLEFTWSTQEGLKSLADLKGKVVVIDFWATWCGPCIRAFPMIREEVAHFAGSPVVVLGVTSLQGRVNGIEPKPIPTKDDPAKEYSLTAEFIKKQNMTWPVVFSKQNVFNPDYGVIGIPHLTIIAPDGTIRHNGLNPHDPAANVVGKVTAILQEFKLPVPAAKSQ